MGVLAQYIEAAGIATTQVSLIRLHTERIRPPRALWVPFELGRPFGVPGDADFQHRVLAAALGLLGEPSGPVIADFREEAPTEATDSMDGWACPMPVRVTDKAAGNPDAPLLAEIASLQQWHDLFRERRGHTTIGACPVNIGDIARGLTRMLDGKAPLEVMPEGLTAAQFVKLGSEDLKAFYTESALAMPGQKSARQIADWLWGETEAGRLLFALKPVCISSEDSDLQAVGKLTLVPRNQLHRAPDALSGQDFKRNS